ncbi:MAG: hypothetical protein PHN88_11695 [Ignavibacteria bacterium]|nr:hypothetical protein [Ignavibacteria bacterium]
MDSDNKDNINKDLNGGSESGEPVKKSGRKPGSLKQSDKTNTEKVITEHQDSSEDVNEIPADNAISENKETVNTEISEVTENSVQESVMPPEKSTNTPSNNEEKIEEVVNEVKVNEEEKIEPEIVTGKDESVPEEIKSKEIKPEGVPEVTDNVSGNAKPVVIENENTQPSSDSNYQVSLIDENILKINVLTNKSVLIDCSVKDKAMGKPSEETQSNKIFIHPKTDESKQEVEVLVTIGADDPVESVKEPAAVIEQADAVAEDSNTTAEAVKEEKAKEEPVSKTLKGSNYQVTLVDESVLKIKIPTKKSVSIDSSLKDKSGESASEETQSNKIFIHPKAGAVRREVEVFIKIGVKESEIYKKESKQTEEEKKGSPSGTVHKLTPNPLVADLINKFRDPKDEDLRINGNRTREEILEDRLGKKNPWRVYHELLERNLLRGFVSANVISVIAMIIVFSITPKNVKDDEIVEQKRLIVMQDIPENLNQMNQNVDDPNKPPETPKDDGTTGTDVTTPKINTPKIKPPKFNVPKLNTTTKDTNISSLNNELDSLRRKNYTGKNGNSGDTGKVNTSLMPDSLLKNLTDNEVGLVGKFPPNWKQIDSRSININQTEFSGIILVDTTARKKEEALNVSIQLDTKGDYWKQFQFKNVFYEDSLRTIYSIEPKIEAKLTYYRFYVASRIENVFIASYVEPSAFDKYKAEIERVVKTIVIRKPEKK